MTKFYKGNTKASRLAAEQVFAIRQRYAERTLTGIRQDDLAREFQVSLTTIRNILNGVTWQRVPMIESEEAKASRIAESQRLLGELLKEKDDAQLLKEIVSGPESVPPWDKPGPDVLARFRKPSDPPVGGAVPQVDIEETRTDDDQD